jgi:hypothetical protein
VLRSQRAPTHSAEASHGPISGHRWLCAPVADAIGDENRRPGRSWRQSGDHQPQVLVLDSGHFGSTNAMTWSSRRSARGPGQPIPERHTTGICSAASPRGVVDSPVGVPQPGQVREAHHVAQRSPPGRVNYQRSRSTPLKCQAGNCTSRRQSNGIHSGSRSCRPHEP